MGPFPSHGKPWRAWNGTWNDCRNRYPWLPVFHGPLFSREETEQLLGELTMKVAKTLKVGTETKNFRYPVVAIGVSAISQVKEKGLLYFRKPDVNHQEGQ